MESSWGILALACGALSAAAPVKFDLPDTNGARHSAEEWRAKKAVVLFFTMTDCPLANGYVPEMNRLARPPTDRRVLRFMRCKWTIPSPTLPSKSTRRSSPTPFRC